jgi:hypothetical protein
VPDILGATRDDVLAQQRTVVSLLMLNGATVDAHRGTLPASDLDAWAAAAKRALAFNSLDVSSNPFTLNDQFTQGKSVLAEMNAWQANLSKAGLTPPPVTPYAGPGTFAHPGPPVFPYLAPQEAPSGQGLLDQLTSSPALLLLLAWAVFGRSGR